MQSCAGNVTALAPTEDPTSSTGTFPAALVYVPASIVFMLLCCGGLLVYRCLKRSGFFSRIPSPSLPNPVLIRRREPPPSSALAQRLEEATNRALYGPADEAAKGDRLPASWSALDPGRNKTKDLPISRLWETWEEEEHRYLGTSAVEQAQLVGKSGLADGRSSWSRRLPTTLQKNGQASAAVPWSSLEDRRLIPPIRKPVAPTKMPSDGESEDIAAQEEAEEPTPKSPIPVTAPLAAVVEECPAIPPPAAAAAAAEPDAEVAAQVAGPPPEASPAEVQMLLQRLEQLEAQLQARLPSPGPAEGANDIAVGQPPPPEQEASPLDSRSAEEPPTSYLGREVQAELPPPREAREETSFPSRGPRKHADAAREGPPDCALQEEEAIFRALPRQSERGVPGVDVLAACAAHADVGAESAAERGRRFWRFKQFTMDETVPPGARSNPRSATDRKSVV